MGSAARRAGTIVVGPAGRCQERQSERSVGPCHSVCKRATRASSRCSMQVCLGEPGAGAGSGTGCGHEAARGCCLRKRKHQPGAS